MRKFLMILVLFAAAPAAAQVVEGVVVNSVTGAGIAGVKVDLFWSGDTAYTTTTAAQGQFLFDHVQDGAYTAGYTAPDFEWEDMFRGPPGNRTFRVAAGGNPVELVAHMMPMGRLSGRVVDAMGEAVPRAQLRVIGPGMQLVSNADDHGKFDLHKFMFPGAYRLSVAAPPGLKPPEPDPQSDLVMAWARTYYPGVTDPEAAQKIVLPPGGELWDLELKLKALPAHAVHGVLLGPDGKPAAKVEIALNGPPANLRATSGPDGAFEFPAVVDGQWNLSAEVETGGVKLRARQGMEMAKHDREGVKLQLNAPFTVRGKVVLETPKGMTPPRARFVSLFHTDHRGPDFERTSPPPGPGSPDESGNFTIQPVYPDTYEIRSIAPPGYYLDAIKLGDAALTNPEVEISSGAAAIAVVYKTNGGTLRGAVEDCAFGGILLVPQDPAMRWPDWVHQARCDANNRYEMPALRPGDYYALAIAKNPSSVFWDPQWDDSLLSHATPVTVRAGEATVADLRAIAQAVY